ncbi:MAG: ribonuclease III [Lentisphaeria bacterium]|nr:ribonuclease III [Lentisphaeria bacterium]
MPEDIEKLKLILNYHFNDRSLLKTALTHRSFAVENNLDYDNQRLEFLGDAVLEIILTEYLYLLYPNEDEGNMTKIRSAMVREDALADFARKLQLDQYIYMGKGEMENSGNERNSTLADLFEAVVGAWYLDGGIEPVKKFVLDLIAEFFPDPAYLLRSLNPKGTLQEYAQKEWGSPPFYTVLKTSGPEHNLTYEVEVKMDKYTAVGVAQSRKSAEIAAAAALLRELNLL